MSDSTFKNIGANGADHKDDPPPGPPATLPRAAQGTPAQEGKKSCSVQAGPGNKGVDGNTGGIGANGGVPGDGNQIKIDLAVMEGNYIITVAGGDAGSGGPGGIGGTGQQGGPGGSGTDHCGGGAVGPGGSGGRGGNGGDGPNGGNGGDIYITFASGTPTFAASITGGKPGRGGHPGNGGPPGDGNPPGGSLGTGGFGSDGLPGKTGQLFVNGKKHPAKEA